ncbi:hypothetical protein CEXT_801031 [Caerostris extrusa]|uniref:Uncharacterized protein n=1 Tax=Caerostris extrusa TaxID=172846 RepID=A0AAV4NI16_CAEEX|nr:hypothetical protein CEXT_801031 [Caerostris extrusa]
MRLCPTENFILEIEGVELKSGLCHMFSLYNYPVDASSYLGWEGLSRRQSVCFAVHTAAPEVEASSRTFNAVTRASLTHIVARQKFS